MHSFLPDLKLAFRRLLKSPGFTAIAVLSLALGIAANVTVYTWLRQLVLEPLPGVHRSNRLVAFDSNDSEGHANNSYPDFKDLRDENQVFQGIFAGQQAILCLDRQEGGERVHAFFANSNMFEVLGVKAAQGRFFRPEDDQPGQPLSVVLSDRFWRRKLGADPTIVGRDLLISGRPFRVLGIAPAGFYGPVPPSAFDLFLPLEPFVHQGGDPEYNLTQRNSRSYFLYARLKDDVSVPEARQTVRAFGKLQEQRHPRTNKGIRINAYPLSEVPYGSPVVLAKPMALLLVMVAFILLMGCANVANLLLAKGIERQRELALRSAVGASRGRLLAQLLTESAVLGLTSGLVGILLTRVCLRFLPASIPSTLHMPMVFEVRMDAQAFSLALALSMATALLFGTLPALRGSRRTPAVALKEGGSRSGGGVHHRIQALLLVAETALAVTLLIGASLMVKSAWEISRDKPGFEPKGLLYASLGLDMLPMGTDKAARLAQDILDRVKAIPGVESAAFTELKPLNMQGAKGCGLNFEGQDPALTLGCSRNLIGPDFFATFRIPLRSGREFNLHDGPKAQPVVIVNEALAARYWPGQEAVGKRIQVNGDWRTVVGVCANFKAAHWSERAEPFVYLPLAQWNVKAWNLAVRVRGSVEDTLLPLRRAVLQSHGSLPVHIQDMQEVAFNAATLVRMSARMLAILGLMALLLAATGIYGVMAHAVSQRTAEIGLRMAVGASPSSILAMVLRRGLLLAAAGTALGLAGAYALGQGFADILHRTSPTEPLIFLAVPIVLLLVALAACAVPALRAATVPPNEALRSE